MTETESPQTASPQSATSAVTGANDESASRRARKRKRKRRYSSGSGELQRLERGVTKASYRIANSVAVGLNSYYERSQRSGRKKKDGAILDAAWNTSLALGEAIREASRAPVDLAKRVPAKTVKRAVRSALGFVSRFVA